MQETSESVFSKSVYFENSDKSVNISISFQNCKKEDYRKLFSVINVLIDDIKATLEI